MNGTAVADRQRWLVAGGSAAMLGIVLAVLIHFPRAASFEAPMPARSVELRRVAATDLAQREEAALRDLAPLFLPTNWNASLPGLPQRVPVRTFFDRETTRYAFEDAGWSSERDLPEVVTIGGKSLAQAGPLEALAANNPAPPLTGFGRSETTIADLEPRGGYIEVVALESGQRVLSVELPPNITPGTDRMWAPVEFLAAVQAAGLVAPLSVTSRSGVEEVDAFFRTYLTRTFRLGARLTPGFYRVTVAP